MDTKNEWSYTTLRPTRLPATNHCYLQQRVEYEDLVLDGQLILRPKLTLVGFAATITYIKFSRVFCCLKVAF
jgi:hypothetical protein